MWLREVTLESKQVKLIPLEMAHAEHLVTAASDGNLWELWFTSVPNKHTIHDYIAKALKEKEQGTSLPFVVINKNTNQIIGSTRFCNADLLNHRVEIGYTWYAKAYQRTSINTECKKLLLTYAFEELFAIAVEFCTHWHNYASRAAISRLGAKQDGVLRNHKIMSDGSYRDTVVFSIINSEWPAVKMNLEHKLKPRH
ncbi:GCN5 family acetyltransferase [Photobacterium jeanii]|uniref:GCN5 family acetyltransferase n=1 Tax=Photobacterium jeanii TaxID=858640 RepID=A0A178KLN6_9GAMM|nr:GNAT family protein [Photobacterium jeanii]OAN17915.1 GCN5 family acetyltransferase [Photobacterium jeanii]PST92416.1 N-acetyltransferase [Photobacterium jeanii]